MKLQDAHPRCRSIIEPLEQRIAPALLVQGANLLGAGNPTTGETSIGGNSVTLVKVLSGDAIVWFDAGQIAAISVGPNTSLDITGDVGITNSQGLFIPGPIIGNLTASGHLTDSDNNPANGLDGDVLLPNNIVGITTHPLGPETGTIGNIITGGSVSNLNISGELSGVYAGDGAFYTGSSNANLNSHVQQNGFVYANVGVDTNPIQPGIQNLFVFAPSNARTVESGASITNVKIGTAGDALQMFAGDGFAGTAASPGHAGTPGLPGGSISNITLENAYVNTQLFPSNPPSYNLMAGSGGSGTHGGAGGGVKDISEITSAGVVEILGGQGGAGLSGPGGVGGSISALNMESDSSAYTVHAGKGGPGAPGGAGGSVKNVNFGGDQLSNGIVVAAPFTGGTADDILLIDAQTGSMIIEQNNGNGTGFTPVTQDQLTTSDTIPSQGTTPVDAIAVDIGGVYDIVVAYAGSDALGVFLNQGGGVFYINAYTGNQLTSSTLAESNIALGYAPSLIAAANFTGDGSTDLVATVDDAGTPALMTIAGNGAGGFTPLTALIPLTSGAVSLIPADIQGGAYSDLFIGFKNGLIDSLLSTGSSTGLPFTVNNSGVTVAGGLANLDYNPQEGLLMALNGAGNTINVYGANAQGSLAIITSINLGLEPGTALVAHYVPETQSLAEPIEVLSAVGSASRLDIYSQGSDSYTLTSSTDSAESLKNFVPVLDAGSTSGVAAVGNSVEHFSFSQNGGAFFNVELPFTGKTVTIDAGDGGNGVVGSTAAGGAGGAISGMSIVAGQITLQAGNGGTSIDAPAGAGGAILDTPTLVTYGGTTITTTVTADSLMVLTAGGGGTSSGTSHTATGGIGGAVEGLNMTMIEGNTTIFSGGGGDGSGGNGGNGGMVTAIKSVDNGGDLDITTGLGGSALGPAGNGGAGGSISNINHSLSLAENTLEAAYGVNLTANNGGDSNGGTGGAGGSISNVSMSLEAPEESVNNSTSVPPTVHENLDSTVRVAFAAGTGGTGAIGGAGGSIKNVNATAVFNQILPGGGIEINPVAAQFTAGSGNTGSTGVGGAGGAISDLTLVGISHFDPDAADPQAGDTPLVITSGNGGNGGTVGGAGGAIAVINSYNAQYTPLASGLGGSSGTQPQNLTGTQLAGASITSGTGGNGGSGNGGAGGTVSGLNIGVSGWGQASEAEVPSGGVIFQGGQMNIQAGGGGSGGVSGKGGVGGSVSSSLLGCAIATDEYGLLLQGGPGGSGGAGGGAGGNVTAIQLNATQGIVSYNTSYDILPTLILAGNGGAATGASAVGGVGGSISQITESKDINTPITVIQAGNGGGAVGTGGAGGSVTQVNTVGLIGQASDNLGNTFGVFQTGATPGYFDFLFPFGSVPQGVFAGDGGTGATAGVAGSVTYISAADIAAIGAAMNGNGLFAAASKVANITANYIAYDQNGNGLYDNVSGTNLTPPSQAVPIDGFIFSDTAPTKVVTFDNTLLENFTFVA